MNTPSDSSKGAETASNPAPVRQPAPTATILDHELIQRIGGGSYGEVWLARNALGAYRAVKVIYRKSFEDDRPFEREFNGIQKFEPISRSHEGLVDILQVGRQEDYFYYVMELADDINTECAMPNVRSPSVAASPVPRSTVRTPDSYVPHTLSQSLNQHGRLPASECVEIGLALTSALAHMHRHGLVHRDIKPSNIIFVDGAPKLADIGLVTEADTTLSYVGTEGYIPPEGPGAMPADIYGLGKVLYEMATGQDRRQFPDLPPKLDDWPDQTSVLELNEVLIEACSRDVRGRYQSCEEMHSDLERLQRGQSVKRHRLWQRRWGFVRTLGLTTAVTTALIFLWSVFNAATRGHTPDPEAVRLYELGRWHYSQLTPEAHQKALEFLTQAVERDPKFTQPYAELMGLYTWNDLPWITNEQVRLEKVQEIADKALAVNPNSAEGHMALSWCRFLRRDWRGAEDEIQRAIKLNPNLAMAHDAYCFYLSMQGRVQEAHREGQLSAKQSPVSQRASAIIASWTFTAERRFDLAIAELKQVLELDRNFASGHYYLGDCYGATSNYVAAIEEYKTADLLSGKDPARVASFYTALREAYDAGGEQGYLRKRIELIRQVDHTLPENQRLLDDGSDWLVAGYYARLGEKEKALDELEKHFDEPQCWHQIKFLPEYDNLHDEPRFKALLKRAGL